MKDPCCKSGWSTEDVTKTITDAIETQVELAGKVFGFWADGADKLMRGVAGQAKVWQTRSCCDIPEPCWMPGEIGEVVCHLCPGGRGIVRLRVINTNFRPRAYHLATAGEAAAQISFDRPSFTLGPKERRVVTATFTVPDKNDTCPEELEALIWVLGCRNHYLRWIVVVGKKDRPCCHEFDVPDGPDYIHHWYDHFYCPRPCFGQAGGTRTKEG